MKTDAQVINFYRAVQHGEAIVIDATSETLAALTENDADIVKRINLLFDMMAELTGSTRIRLSQIIDLKTWCMDKHSAAKLGDVRRWDDGMLHEKIAHGWRLLPGGTDYDVKVNHAEEKNKPEGL